MHRTIKIFIAIAFILSITDIFYVSRSCGQQDLSIQERIRETQEKEKALRKKIEKPKVKPEVEEKLPKEAVIPKTAEKILVKQIDVVGATLVSEKEIRDIVSPFKNKQLTLREMQKVADLITDAYRRKGYITSRTYLPPQKVKQGVLEIRVLEAAMGDLQIKGNRFFKTSLLRKKITLEKGEPFNYNILRRDLVKINEHPDRTSRAVFMPGKEPGATDVVLEVKDRLPIHLTLGADNFGSRFIDKYRYLAQLEHNNLLGLDDKLTFQYQLAQSSRYYLKNVRYLLPLGNSAEIGAYAAFSRIKLGQDYEDQDVRGKGRIYGIFGNIFLINTENFDFTLNLGFDYKDIKNYQNQAVTSKDKLRIVKAGFETDATDNFGRTLFNYELDCGIPKFMGSLERKDSDASRTGAGGKFVKHVINFLRLQKMPFSTNLLWKNQIQLSPYVLPATEQFQLGGISNVRGYPPAEAVGDSGYAMTWEWSVPFYPVPKEFKVPFSKAKLYDALRFVAFYDWGNVHLNTPTATEEKNRTLKSAGCGIRFNLPEDFSVRVEVAWPLDNPPTDDDNVHTWMQITKGF